MSDQADVYLDSGLSLSHIIASSGRVPTSRLIAVLASDLREFIGSGMLTFKAKFDNYDEIKLVARVAEQWTFFWAQVLPVSLLIPVVSGICELS